MLNYIKVAQFAYAAEYAVLKLLLEQQEIRFFFQNETGMTLLSFNLPHQGGIFLKVHPDDVEETLQIIRKFNLKMV